MAVVEQFLGSWPTVNTPWWSGTARSPSHRSQGGWCLKQRFCHSHRIKCCIHCWEALRCSGLNNSLLKQKWAKNMRRAHAPRPACRCGRWQGEQLFKQRMQVWPFSVVHSPCTLPASTSILSRMLESTSLVLFCIYLVFRRVAYKCL